VTPPKGPAEGASGATDVSTAIDALVAAAVDVRLRAHAPYSRYRVGAAILTRDGRTFAGCNVENASYGATICAERNAIARMVAEGARDPVACVVVTQGEAPGSPCGMCRQVLAEFARDLRIVLVGVEDTLEQANVANAPRATEGPQPASVIVATRETTLDALLPDAFRLNPIA
jgi:cytidine deaminase